MIEHFSIQTRFKHPYKRSSNSLATHTPYNPRTRLKTREASERLTGHRTYAEAARGFHLPARQPWNIIAVSPRTESSRMGRTHSGAETRPKHLRLNPWSDGNATTVAARGAP